MWFKYSSNFSSGGYFVFGEAKRIVQLLVEGSMTNISTRHFYFSSGGHFVQRCIMLCVILVEGIVI